MELTEDLIETIRLTDECGETPANGWGSRLRARREVAARVGRGRSCETKDTSPPSRALRASGYAPRSLAGCLRHPASRDGAGDRMDGPLPRAPRGPASLGRCSGKAVRSARSRTTSHSRSFFCFFGTSPTPQDGQEVEVEAGAFWRSPGGVPHGIRTGEVGALVLDIFSPPREAYKRSGEGFGESSRPSE